MFNFNTGLSVLLVALLLGIYTFSLPNGLQEGDFAEFLIQGVYGGISHPPGYGVYVLSLNFIAKLPFDPIGSFAVFSCLLVAGAAWLMFRSLVNFKVEPFCAFLAVAICFSSTPIWRQANNIEPFALTLFLASILTFTLSRNVAPLVVGFIFGLAIFVHHTLFLLFPATLLFLPLKRKIWVKFISGVCLALPFIFVYWLQRDNPLNWGDWQNSFFSTLIHHLLRRDYGTWQLSPLRGGFGLGATRHFFSQNLFYFSGIGLVFLFLGFVKIRAIGKPAYFALLAFAFSGPLFLLLVGSSPQALDALVVERFYALPLLFLSIPLAFGLNTAINSQYRKPLLTLFLVSHIFLQFPYANRSDSQVLETHAKNIAASAKVKSLPLFLSSNDLDYNAARYARYFLDAANLQILHIPLWSATWYRKAFLPDFAATDYSVFSATDLRVFPVPALPRRDWLNPWEVAVLSDYGVKPKGAF